MPIFSWGDAVVDKTHWKRAIRSYQLAFPTGFHSTIYFFMMPSLFFFSRFFPMEHTGRLRSLECLEKNRLSIAMSALSKDLLHLISVLASCCFSVFSPPACRSFVSVASCGRASGRAAGGSVVFHAKLATVYVARALRESGCCSELVFSVYYFKIDPATNPWFDRTAGVQQLADRF